MQPCLISHSSSKTPSEAAIPAAAKPIVTLLVVGLILLNALAVTSLTNERDSRALDLLLVTDLSPKEIVFGKLGGAFYNAKEMILLPIALCVYLWFAGAISTENVVFLPLRHRGNERLCRDARRSHRHELRQFANGHMPPASARYCFFFWASRPACESCSLSIRSKINSRRFSRSSPAAASGCIVALNWRVRSNALTVVAGTAPFATIFAITSFLVGNYGAVFLVIVCTYGFATWAMLVPAIYVFDVATGRTTAREE